MVKSFLVASGFLLLSCSKEGPTIYPYSPPSPLPTILNFEFGYDRNILALSSLNTSSGNIDIVARDGGGSALELNFPLGPPPNDTFSGYGTVTYKTPISTYECNSALFTVIYSDTLISGTFSGDWWSLNGVGLSFQVGYGNFPNISLQ